MPVPMTIDGDVVEVHSRWTADQARIVTDSTVRTATGDVVVTQTGGTVDGIGMIQFPGPELLAPGMKVSLAAHRGLDLSQHEHIAVDATKVISYPAGFVRTGPAKGGHYLYWKSGCVFVTPDAAGTRELAGDLEFDIIAASVATWNDDGAACSYMNVMIDPPQALEVSGKDRVNVIKFRDDYWGIPATDGEAADPHPVGAAGITTATYINSDKSDRDGEILDADIEINGVNFAISVNGVSSGTDGCKSDLQNTLTHELGHLHGLEHTCRLSDMEPARVDGDGNAVPLCNTVLPDTPAHRAIIDATMYPTQSCGETSKSTLSPDDIAGLCKIYPIADDPGTCEEVKSSSGGGCCSASSDRPDVSFLLAGAVGLFVFARRRRAS